MIRSLTARAHLGNPTTGTVPETRLPLLSSCTASGGIARGPWTVRSLLIVIVIVMLTLAYEQTKKIHVVRLI